MSHHDQYSKEVSRANNGGVAFTSKLTERASVSAVLPAALVAACFLSSSLAHSADLDTSEAAISPPEQFDTARYGGIRGKLHDWKVTVGVGAIYLPEYEGSDEFEVQPFPIVSAEFGDRLHLDSGGLIVDLYETNGFRIGVTGGVEMGRKEDDSDYLRGLGDVEMGGVIGGIVSYEIGPFELYAKLDKTIGGSDGLTSTFGAKASHRYEQFVFSADVSGTWADDNHMESYFGVTADQSARSGLAQYQAEAGVKRVDVKASITYLMTENWSLTGAAGAGFLVGDAKDSPIVKDDVQPFAMLGVGYRF